MNDHPTKIAIDIAAGGIAISTLAAWLPPVAALFTIIWTGIRIFETRTIQRLLGKNRE